jgi:Protein ENHANCED DISEASE RESISTANCE 2, C-terminal
LPFYSTMSRCSHPTHRDAADTAPPHTIRHAGRAYVRGRFRRVWRPRYLELTDEGHLQYYELLQRQEPRSLPLLPSSSTKEWKYTLTVASARILDVTTLRDLHTGLPRGSFGFLVRGQRISVDSSAWTGAGGALLPTPTILGSTADANTAAGGSFVLAAADDAESQPVRDYLCAVPTLEEAQMWVVALQWAAAQVALPTTPSDHWWKVDYNMASLDRMEPTQQEDAKVVPTEVATETPAEATPDMVSKAPDPPRSSRGKILVTVVTGYSIVRWSTWALEIAYDIHAMLLYPSPSNETDERTAEQWTLQRTAAQFELLAAEFRESTGEGKDDDTALIRRLPRWKERPALPEVEQSLSIVDSLLRSWVLSADLVNTTAFKQFLGMARSTEAVDEGPLKWWRVHSTHPFSIGRLVTTVVPSQMTSDVFVREWLLAVRSSSKSVTSRPFLRWIGDSRWMMQWRHHQQRYLYWMGGAAVAVFGILPAAYPLWRSLMPVVPVRLDYLLASWVGASLVGHRIGISTQKCISTASADKSKNGVAVTRNRPTAPVIPGGSKTAPRPSARKPSLASVSSAVPEKNDLPPSEPDSPKASSQDDSAVMVADDMDSLLAAGHAESDDFADFCSTDSHPPPDDDDESDGEADGFQADEDVLPSGGSDGLLSSPLPKYPGNNGFSCWSQPNHDIFHVRGATYFSDKIKVCSGPAPLTCRGVDVWITDNPERHIARHPAVLGGKLGEEDTFLVNFLLPFGNFVAYFAIPPLSAFPEKLRGVWTKFLKGDQQYRDARLKLLPVVVDGPWIVKTAVGPGKSPALLGKAIPLQYFFSDPEHKKKGFYEVDVIITASSIAKGILSVVKSQTKSVSIAFAFIIEAAEQSELPETVLCSFQVHSLHLEDCPLLPECNLDGGEVD